MEGLKSSSILIQSYMESFKKEPTVELLPKMTYEELSDFLRKPRITPKGHAGPTPAMVRSAEKLDRENARRVDRVIKIGKDLETQSQKPFF